MSAHRHPAARRALGAVLLAGLGLLLGGCGERAQELQVKGPDASPWSGKPGGFGASGWQGGDQSAWQEQIRQRGQRQNEYARTGVSGPGAAGNASLPALAAAPVAAAAASAASQP
ncbi:hypothetical protein ACU6VG_03690 [Sphaerotilus sulfidivorans]|uniref:hypothetical protein n=1 Tax=Sphaerotilus sp. FB-3 TaxID=2913396 RepID=UPI00203E62D5|nr:hypothetical protein [Sphaerotilus sp. FB-3]GKQ58788.1 hypothetical protein QMTAC487_26480 [Sphaerotilus sp. FB-3]